MIDRFAVYSFGVGIPPGHTALIRTESFLFCLWHMVERLAAVFTNFLRMNGQFVYRFRTKIISSAVRFYGIFKNAERSSYGGVACTFAP
jgi:hypothetical protein